MIEFLYPQIIPLIIIPLAIFAFVAMTRKGKVLKDFSEEVLEKLESSKIKGVGRKTRFVVLLLSLFMMSLSLARPVLNHGEREVLSKGVEITAFFDISTSMLASDIYPSRLEFAKEKLKQFIKVSANDEIAVIAYAGGSFLVSPPTNDKETLLYLLDSISPESVSMGGSDLTAAFKGLETLKSKTHKAVLIFSDGGDESLDKELEYVKEKEIKVYGVGIGSKEGSPIRQRDGQLVKDRSGNIVISKLNVHLQNLSLSSGGAYVKATPDTEDMKTLYGVIKKDLKVKEYERKNVNDYTELFYYPLGFGLLLLLFGFFSFPVKRLAVVAMLFLPTQEHAISFDFDKMEKAKKQYREGNYQEAIKYYKKVRGGSLTLEAKKHYNIGSAYYKMGDYENAVKSYEKSLELEKDEDTKFNLEAAKRELQKKKQQKEKNKQKNNKKEDNKSKEKEKENQEKNSDKEEQEKKNKDSKKQEEGKKDEQKSNEKNPDDLKETEPDSKELTEREQKIYMDKMKKIENPLRLRPMIRGRRNDKTW